METEGSIKKRNKFYGKHPASKSIPGYSPFSVVAYDVLMKIFGYLSLSELLHGNTHPYYTCWRWFRILKNINQLILLWPIEKGSFEGFHRTSSFLKLTKFPPSQKTVTSLNWTYTQTEKTWTGKKNVTVEDRLFSLFVESYSPKIWQNMPLPTWEQTKKCGRCFEGTKANPVCGLEAALVRGNKAFSHVLNLMKENEPEKYRQLKFDGHILDRLAWGYDSYRSISVKFVDWFIHQPFCTVTPYGLGRLVEAKFPLEKIREYAELPIQTNWNEYDHKDQKLESLEEGRKLAYYEIYRAYQWRLYITEQNYGSINHDPVPLPYNSETVRGFCYFYRKCPLNKVRDVLQISQNGLISRPYSRAVWEFLNFIETILQHCSDVHPIEELHSWDWHITERPFRKFNRAEEDRKARLYWEKHFEDG